MAENWKPKVPKGWKLADGPKRREMFYFADGTPEATEGVLQFDLKTKRPMPDPPDLSTLLGVADGTGRFGAPPGAVLVEGYDLSPERMRDGSVRWTINVRLTRRLPSWNHARHRPTGTFTVMTDANGQPPHVPADVFDQLERLAKPA